jgi:hypothetical protein
VEHDNGSLPARPAGTWPAVPLPHHTNLPLSVSLSSSLPGQARRSRVVDLLGAELQRRRGFESDVPQRIGLQEPLLVAERLQTELLEVVGDVLGGRELAACCSYSGLARRSSASQ